MHSLNTNSRDFERWRQLSEQSLEKQIVADMLWEYENVIRNGLETLQNDLDPLLKKLESL